MPKPKIIVKVVLPLFVLIGAIAAVAYLQATKPKLDPKASAERDWLITTTQITIENHQPDLVAYGEIVSQRSVYMRTLVGGQVIAVGKNFLNGGTVKKSDLLVQIDPFHFKSSVADFNAQLNRANAQLDEINANIDLENDNLTFDREQLRISERELKRRIRLAKNKVISEKALDDARLLNNDRARAVSRTENSIKALRATFKGQEAVINQKRVSLKQAQRDLANTKLYAPFDGFLTETNAAIGQNMPINGQVTKLIDLDRLEAKFYLSNDEFGRLVAPPEGLIGRAARVVWRVGSKTFSYMANISRIEAEIDKASGGIQIYARIDSSRDDSPLRPGAFVEIFLPDRLYTGVARLPESALYDDKKIYVVINDRLTARDVTLVARLKNDVLVRGDIVTGDMAVITRFSGIGPGVKVTIK